MNLLFRMFRFEFRLIKKRYYLSVFLLSFLCGYLPVAAAAGIFGDDIYSPAGVANSDFSLIKLTGRFIYLLAFLIAGFAAEIFSRERKNKFDQLFYSYPLNHALIFFSKLGILFFLILILILCFLLGSIFPVFHTDINPNYITIPRADVYLLLLFAYLLPAGVLITSLTAVAALYRREFYAPSVVVIIFFILKQVLSFLYIARPEVLLSSIADLLGDFSLNLNFSGFGTNEVDAARLILPNGYLLARIFYFHLALTLLFFTYRRFCTPQLEGQGEKYNHHKRFRLLPRWDKMFAENLFAHIAKTRVLAECIALWKISGISFYSIIKEKTFLWVLVSGFGVIGLILTGANLPHNIQLQPATWIMLAYPMFFFSLFIKILTVFYTAVVLNRNQTYKMHELIDSAPFSSLKMVIVNLGTLVRIQVLLMIILFIVMLGIQLYRGYEYIDISLYIVSLITIHLPDYIIFLIFSFFIQTILNSFYPGMFASLGFMFLFMQPEVLGIQSNLLRFNTPPLSYFYLNYSELSGFGRDLVPYYIYKFYWLLFSGILFFLTVSIYPRRLNRGIVRFSALWNQPIKRSVLFIFTAICIAFGGMIYFIKNEEQRIFNNDNGTAYSAFNTTIDVDSIIKYSPAPRIMSKDITIDLYPQEQSLRAGGKYICVNKNLIPIEWIVLRQSEQTDVNYYFSSNAQVCFRNSLGKYSVFKLADPLQPGDTISFQFTLSHSPHGILDQHTLVQSNGTYITSEIFPTLGFRSDSPDFADPIKKHSGNHYRADDADFISLSIKVSTLENQIALAPGSLVNNYTLNGRNYSHYIFPGQVTPEFAVLSGEYAIHTEVQENDTLQVYYHPDHHHNIAHTLKGLRVSRDFYSGLFGKPLHSVLRIVEFSRQNGNYAQAFNTLIAYSESGFILDTDTDPDKSINLPFLGAAHEMAHLWWGTQVVPADAPGYKLITESISEYLAYKVYQKQFGKKAAQLILEKAMSDYMKKSLEAENEKPLSLVYDVSDNFAAYQKGLIVFCILEDLLGESKLTDILSGFFDRYAVGRAQYPSAGDLIDYILQNSSSSLQAKIKNLFTTVWHHAISVNEVKSLVNGSIFQTVLQLEFKTLQKNELNQFLPENSFPDTVEIGLYAHAKTIPPDTIIKVGLHPGINKISLETVFRPERIVIDPRYKFFFRTRSNLIHKM